MQLVDLCPEQPLPTEEVLEYDLRCAGPGGEVGLRELLPCMVYPHACRPSLVIPMRLDDLVHGS